MKGVLSDESEFHLNLKYSSKRTKFKILPVTRVEVIEVSGVSELSGECCARIYNLSLQLTIWNFKFLMQRNHVDLISVLKVCYMTNK